MTKQTHKLLLFRATIFGICHLFEKRHRIANITSPSWVNKNVCLRSLHKKNSRSCQICSPGCHVNKQTSANWVRVEMKTWSWPDASASSPVAHHYHDHKLLHLLAQQIHPNCFCPPCTNIDTASTLIDACLFTVWQKLTSAQAFDINMSKCHICVWLIIS